MFTGIIEEVGNVKEINQGKESLHIKVEAKDILSDVQLGDSISVNGVCLTVTSFTETEFDMDVMPETFNDTALRQLKIGSKVNLERAMSANGRFGGHFVSGHVDGVGKIVKRDSRDNAEYFQIQVDPELAKFMMMKGSVSVDGTSLTIFGLEDDTFTISLIPHTQDATILTTKNVGDEVNIECDMLLKYIHQLIFKNQSEEHKSITLETLRETGFLNN